MGLVPCRGLYAVCKEWRTTFLTSPHPQLFVNMQFTLVQSSQLGGFSRELTKISIGGAIPLLIERMGLLPRRSLYAVFTDLRTTFVTSPQPQLFVNMQFAFVQSSHLAAISRELTRIFIGGAIPRWMGIGLVAVRSLYAVSTDWRTTFFYLSTPTAFC